MEIVHRRLPIPHLPDWLHGTRLVQLSDLHIGPRVAEAYLLQVFNRVRDLAPEILVYTAWFGLLGFMAGPALLGAFRWRAMVTYDAALALWIAFLWLFAIFIGVTTWLFARSQLGKTAIRPVWFSRLSMFFERVFFRVTFGRGVSNFIASKPVTSFLLAWIVGPVMFSVCFFVITNFNDFLESKQRGDTAMAELDAIAVAVDALNLFGNMAVALSIWDVLVD